MVKIGIFAGAVCLAADNTVPSPPRTIANSIDELNPSGTQFVYASGLTC